MYQTMFIECFEQTTEGCTARAYRRHPVLGNPCVGFVFESMGDLFGALARAAIYAAQNGLSDEFAEEAAVARYDSMGRGVILYFPCVAWDEQDGRN